MAEGSSRERAGRCCLLPLWLQLRAAASLSRRLGHAAASLSRRLGHDQRADEVPGVGRGSKGSSRHSCLASP